jgi:16S rRNA (cytidine1402-2'-O)-methyltransferase
MGKLSIVATPIGNLDDITIRAIKTLLGASAILCEDTRHSGMLVAELVKRYGEQFDTNPEWKPELIAYYDEVEDKRIPEVIQRLEGGEDFALISDAGTPLVSDPGFRLVRECVKRGIKVESIPGASALLTALTSSGLPSDKFMFLGYPSEKQSQRIKLFENLKAIHELIKTSYILYCAPHKLPGVFEDMKQALGDIEIVVCRELTKIHEEIWKGTISQASEKFADPKGEFVLLFHL